MKKPIRYMVPIYKVLLVLLLAAYVNFRLAFTLYDTLTAATDGDWLTFADTAFWIIVLAVLLFPINTWLAYMKSSVTKSIITEMKMDYLKSVFNKNISEFQKDNNAQYVSALTNDFNIIEKDYVEQVMVVLEAVVNFITALIIIVLISPLVLLFGIGLVIFNALVSSLASKPIQKHHKERSIMMGQYSGFIKEALSAFNIIKSNDLETRISENYYEQSKKIQEKKYVIDKIMSYIFAIQNSNFTLTFLVLMFAISYLTIQGVIVFAGVVVVATNLDNIINPVAMMGEAFPKILSVKGIIKRISDTLKNKHDYEETLDFEGINHRIEFKQVAFAYEDNLVFDQLDLTFYKGKKYLVVGPSGGGKSTVLKLLRKYFDPQEGQILIDGNNLKDIKKTDYFSKIANIEQHVFLFEDTLRNNLTLYKEYSDSDINDAIKNAGLESFLNSRPEGLDMVILDNGKNISGGERSRIAIARGLLNKAQIIFLDEAFASLDRDSAFAIEESLLALNDVTIINVSHVIIEEHKQQYDDVFLIKNKRATTYNQLSYQTNPAS